MCSFCSKHASTLSEMARARLARFTRRASDCNPAMDRYIALIAHNSLKDDILSLVGAYKVLLEKENIVAIGTPGGLIASQHNLK